MTARTIPEMEELRRRAGGDAEAEGGALMKTEAAKAAERLARDAEEDEDEGKKYDGGKARYDLIPPEALHQLALLYGKGAAKYGDRNWEKGLPWGRVFAALMRHAWAWWRGEDNDPEDGQHHLIAVAWNAFSLYTYQVRGTATTTGRQDRPEMKEGS